MKLLCELEYETSNPFIDKLLKKGVCEIPVPGGHPTFTLRVTEISDPVLFDAQVAVSPEVVDEVVESMEAPEE